MNATASASPRVTGPCRYCGRIAEGYPGDYARCPHCRKMTKLPPEPPRGWRVVHRPGRLAAYPYYMVTLFYASILAIVVTSGRAGFFAGAAVVVVFAAWILTIMRFGVGAEHQPGWWVPVLGFHVASILLPVGFWLAARGYASMSAGFFDLGAIGSVLGALLVFFTCLLSYGMARGMTARLRIVRM